MAFLYAVELFLILLVVFLAVTQVFLPGLRGTPLFPILRKDRGTLEARLSEVREKADLARLEDEIRHVTDTLKKE